MSDTNCKLKLGNDTAEPLELQLEPYAYQYMLPPGEHVEINLYGKGYPMELWIVEDQENGKRYVTLYPEGGEFGIYHHGRKVLEIPEHEI